MTPPLMEPFRHDSQQTKPSNMSTRQHLTTQYNTVQTPTVIKQPSRKYPTPAHKQPHHARRSTQIQTADPAQHIGFIYHMIFKENTKINLYY